MTTRCVLCITWSSKKAEQDIRKLAIDPGMLEAYKSFIIQWMYLIQIKHCDWIFLINLKKEGSLTCKGCNSLYNSHCMSQSHLMISLIYIPHEWRCEHGYTQQRHSFTEAFTEVLPCAIVKIELLKSSDSPNVYSEPRKKSEPHNKWIKLNTGICSFTCWWLQATTAGTSLIVS